MDLLVVINVAGCWANNMFGWFKQKTVVASCKCECASKKFDIWKELEKPLLKMVNDLTQLFNTGWFSEGAKQDINRMLKENHIWLPGGYTGVYKELIDTIKSLEEYKTLEKNWDGYDANPINPTAILYAQALVWLGYGSKVRLFPNDSCPECDGSVELMWGLDQEWFGKVLHTSIEVVDNKVFIKWLKWDHYAFYKRPWTKQQNTEGSIEFIPENKEQIVQLLKWALTPAWFDYKVDLEKRIDQLEEEVKNLKSGSMV